MLKNRDCMSAPVNAGKDQGLIAAKQFARKHDSEPGHAFQVAKIAAQLFEQTAELHGLGDSEQRLLCAAAMMHDSGYTVSPMRHHKGARDLILKSELKGFSKIELQIVACVARYHRKAHPAQSHRVYGDLDSRSQLIVNQLAALLRIADGLDRGHDAATRKVRVERLGGGVRICVAQRRPSQIDIDGAMRKRKLFEEVFRITVEIIRDEPSVKVV